MFPRLSFVIVLLFSAIAVIPDEKIAFEDTTTRMLERAEEMRGMEGEMETMFYNIEHPSPEPALTDVLPTPAPPELPSTWLAIAEFFLTHTLLTPIFFFWYLRNSGGRWMSFLYMLGMDLEWSLGHDSCLFKTFAVALLFLQVANIFHIRLNFGWLRRRIWKRAPSNPEMKRQSSNTADPPHQVLPLQLSTPLSQLPVVHQSGTFTSIFQDSAIIIVQQTTSGFMMGMYRCIIEIGPQITSITSMMEVDSVIISAYPQSCAITSPRSRGSLMTEDSSIITVLSNVPQSCAITSPPEMCSRGSLMAEDSSIITVLSNVPLSRLPVVQESGTFSSIFQDSAIIIVQQTTSSFMMGLDRSIIEIGPQITSINSMMEEDSAIISAYPQSCAMASPLEMCSRGSLMEEDSSIIAVLSNGADNWMAEDSAIIAVSP